jgi:hypothetical protein
VEKKDCFGILDKVFPMGGRGLREVKPECSACPEKVECLRAAMSTEEGLELRAERLDRAAAAGLISRFQRWSRKKTLSRLIKEEKGKGQ